MTTYLSGTTGVAPAQWTTSGRPSSPQNGQLGWNTTLGQLEVWNGYVWQPVASSNYTANILVVGGGGGSGPATYGGGSGIVILSIPIANYPGNANVTGTYTYANTGIGIYC